MKLRELATIQSASINPQDAPDCLFHLYSLPSFDENQTREEVIGRNIQSNKLIVPNRCILFNKLNVRFKRIWLIDNEDENKVCSTEFLPLVVNEEVVDFYYFFFLLHSPSITSYLTGQNANTSGSHKRIDPIAFLDIEITLPSKSEQKRIGALLNGLREKIITNRQQNELLDKLLQTTFSYFISVGSQRAVLGTLCQNVTDGEHNTVKDTAGGGYFLLSCKNLKDNAVHISQEREIDQKTFLRIRKRTQLQRGDILMSSVGTIGECVYLFDAPGNYEFQRSVAIIKPKSALVGLALYFALRRQREELEILSHGAVQRCIFISDLTGFQVELPKETSIKLFWERGSSMMSQITKNNTQIVELTELQDYLLPLLMNGQVSVKQK